MIKLNGHLVTPTIFPDHTSQVWKLEPNWVCVVDNVITWEFEAEAEFLHLAQLNDLIQATTGSSSILELPYLPYARQDKDISNTATFALRTFADLLNTLKFKEIRVKDPHNVALSKQLIKNLEPLMPNVSSLLAELNALPVYPDAGAAQRYGAGFDSIICDKVREPLAGKIEGITVIGKVEPKTYLIIDDIVDGGRTFIEVAKKLYEAGAIEVHLYCTHGIFSKGLEPLREAGIKRIFTYKGEIL
jgi:ribose-phosphate pyrophosphokinase